MLIAQQAGPLAHARRALGGEPVLWAAFAASLVHDRRGLGERAKDMAVGALDTVVDAIADSGPGQDGPRGPGKPDVVVWGRGGAAHRIAAALPPPGDTGPYLWALTPHRVHIAQRLDTETPPQDPAGAGGSGGAVGKAGGLLRGIAGAFAGQERRPVELRALRPVLDIARAQIAGFSPAVRGEQSCLRLALTDGTGFDLLFLGSARFGADGEADQYERLAALSAGRADPWV
ncbi:hypothetical protein ACFPM7_26735 [Actinokineospora guangxiensis]|uniref:Uncharacterized protein n=1 Tax=Actinokineospora guangxiensis TaxID=1490288 RepID=A0ABW0ETN2_9PSEU